MSTEITIGSVVKLKGGDSPEMNVNREQDNDMVECIWFNGQILKSHIFHKNVLYNMIDYKIASEKFAKMSNEELFRIANLRK